MCVSFPSLPASSRRVPHTFPTVGTGSGTTTRLAIYEKKEVSCDSFYGAKSASTDTKKKENILISQSGSLCTDLPFSDRAWGIVFVVTVRHYHSPVHELLATHVLVEGSFSVAVTTDYYFFKNCAGTDENNSNF